MYNKYHDSVIEVDCQGHQISYNYFKWINSTIKNLKMITNSNLLILCLLKQSFITQN